MIFSHYNLKIVWSFNHFLLIRDQRSPITNTYSLHVP